MRAIGKRERGDEVSRLSLSPFQIRGWPRNATPSSLKLAVKPMQISGRQPRAPRSLSLLITRKGGRNRRERLKTRLRRELVVTR